MSELKKVVIYTDGSCSGNPGKGGWGAILLYTITDKNKEVNTIKKVISGKAEYTTNNKMELTAVIEALKILKEPCEIELFTDSKYVLEGITKWMPKWIKNNWRTANKQLVKNKELWELLNELCGEHKVNFHWVKGHAEDLLNNEVDAIARQ